MKIMQPSEIPTGTNLVVSRQGRWLGTFTGLAMCVFLPAIGLLWWHLDMPWPVYIIWIIVLLLLEPTLFRSIVALWQKSNWVLCHNESAVWINLRSYINYHFPEAKTVVCLDLAEIASAGVYREDYSTPGTSTRSVSTRWRQQFIDLKLAHEDTEELAHAIQEERKRKPPLRSCLGIVKTTSYAKDYPVSVPESGVIRIAWRGRGNRVVPRAEAAVEMLMGRSHVDPAHEKKWAEWSSLDNDEFDALVKKLVTSGDTLSAAKLLCRRHGISLTEATRRIEEL